MKRHDLLRIGILTLIALMFFSGLNFAVTTINQNEYINAYFVIMDDITIRGGRFTGDEFLDIIRYYENNRNDLSPYLSNVGIRSGEQIWTILDRAGAPCDCTPGAPCATSGEKCCCREIFYECNIVWGYTKDCTQGCCGNLCCEDTVTTTTIQGTTTTTITALPNCDNCQPGTTSCVITCPDGSVPFSITGFLIQSCSCSGNTCDVQHSGGIATGIPCPTAGAFTFNLPFLGQVSIPWPF